MRKNILCLALAILLIFLGVSFADNGWFGWYRANQVMTDKDGFTGNLVASDGNLQHDLEIIDAMAGGGGTVTSVALSLPAEFTVTGSPVTTIGTLDGTWADATQNYVFAAPNGSNGTPAFRALVADDIPDLSGTYLTAETDPNALLTAGTDNVKDTHIDWGTGAGQVNPADFANQDIGDITITTGDWAVEDDSHNHTTTTISGLDISADTNLAGTANEITLTDDTLSLATTIDLGDKTSLEIPNGADPVVDAAGEISVDSSATTGSMLRFYGDAAYALPAYQSKSFVITSPTADSDYAVWRVPYAITIRAIHVLAEGGTSLTGGLDEADANGDNAVAVDADIVGTAGSNVNDDGSLTNGGIDAGDYILWHTTSVDGTQTSVTVTFEYTVNSVN